MRLPIPWRSMRVLLVLAVVGLSQAAPHQQNLGAAGLLPSGTRALARSSDRRTRSCSCSPATLCEPLSPQPAARPEQAVFLEGKAYNGTANDGGVWPWQHGVTTVVVFGAGNDTSEAFERTLCEAHRHGARVLLPAGPRITAADNLSSAVFRATWVRTAISRLWDPPGGGAWGLPGWDGLNLDVESQSLGARQGLTELVCLLRAKMQDVLPGSHLTFDSSIDPQLDTQRGMHFDYSQLANCVDYFVPMAYDMTNPHHEPSANSPLPAVESGLRYYIKTLRIPPSKLVLAVPWYGYDIPCQGSAQGACVLDGSWSNTRFQTGYASILQNLLPQARDGVQWNASTSSPYFDYQSNTHRHRVFYDNPRSISLKVALARRLGLRGISVWTADCLPYTTDHAASAAMWAAIRWRDNHSTPSTAGLEAGALKYPPAAGGAAVGTGNNRVKNSVGYDSRITPFYADPVFDAAHDAELVWHVQEQTWWLVYLQNRYNSRRSDELGSGCFLCDFTDLGMASTPDQGRTWIYRGVMQGLDVPATDRSDPPYNATQEYGGATWWRPCVYYDAPTKLYHGFFVYWSESHRGTSLGHYTSANVSHWKFEGWVRHDQKGYDSAVTRMSNGIYLLVSTGGPNLESKDLYTWAPSNNSVKCTDEGPHFSRFGGALWLNVEPRCGPPITSTWQSPNCRGNVAKSEDGGNTWVEQGLHLFTGPGTRQYDHFWAFQGPLVPQPAGALYVLYFTEVVVNTTMEPGVNSRRSMLNVASVSLNDGVVHADRNASFHWVMQPPDPLNVDRGPVQPRSATPPVHIAWSEAAVIAASELERWQPFWRTGGKPPSMSRQLGALAGQWPVDQWGSPPWPYASMAEISSAEACISRCKAESATAACRAIIFGVGRSCASGAILPHASLTAPNYKRVPYLPDARACAAFCEHDADGCGSAVFRPAGSPPGQACGSSANNSCCYLIHDPSPSVELLPTQNMWSSYVSIADTPPAPRTSGVATSGGCCYLFNDTSLASSTRLRKTTSSGWSTWADNVTILTQQQLFRDPAVVSRYFTSIKSIGSGRDTMWNLQLATSFGQTYNFTIDSVGRIEHMWNMTTGVDEELQPLRQFLRDSPAPGRAL